MGAVEIDNVMPHDLISCRNSSKSTLTKTRQITTISLPIWSRPAITLSHLDAENETEKIMQDNKQKQKTEEIFHLKNRKPIIIVIEKKHAINKQHPGLFLYFRIRFQKPKAIQIFFSPKIPLNLNLFLNSLFIPASFLVSN